MKKLYSLILIALFITSCEDKQCVSCIAESKEGKIIETRSACHESPKYLDGFTDGFKEKHQQNTKDSINVYCTYTQ